MGQHIGIFHLCSFFKTKNSNRFGALVSRTARNLVHCIHCTVGLRGVLCTVHYSAVMYTLYCTVGLRGVLFTVHYSAVRYTLYCTVGLRGVLFTVHYSAVMYTLYCTVYSRTARSFFHCSLQCSDVYTVQ